MKRLILTLIVVLVAFVPSALATPVVTCHGTIDLTDRYIRHTLNYIGEPKGKKVIRRGCKQTTNGISRQYNWRDSLVGWVKTNIRVNIKNGKLHVWGGLLYAQGVPEDEYVE